MRRDLKEKLDALERAEKLRRGLLWAALAVLVVGAAFAFSRPSTALGPMLATVNRSVVGVDHWGQEFHQLRVRLGDGSVVPVDTLLINRPLKLGQQVTVTRYQGYWGNVFYRLQRGTPNSLSQPGQSR